MRLERVPGGLRLAEWQAGPSRAGRPCCARRPRRACWREAASKELVADARALADGRRAESGDVARMAAPARAARASCATSCGWSVDGEPRADRALGLRPGAGWQLQEAPVMLPPARFEQALAAAAEQGLLLGCQNTVALATTLRV